MLDSVAIIFDERNLMLGKLKKKNYEFNMNKFRNEHGHYLDEMISYVSNADSKEEAAREISACFCDQVAGAFTNKRGKVSGRKQIDINLFMIYYVFPAIRLIPNDDTKLICDTLCQKWNETFNVSISYSDYNKIYESFNERIFGFF